MVSLYESTGEVGGVDSKSTYHLNRVPDPAYNPPIPIKRETQVQTISRSEQAHSRWSKSTRVRRRLAELPNRIQCIICSKMYGSDTAMLHHMRLKHSLTAAAARQTLFARKLRHNYTLNESEKGTILRKDNDKPREYTPHTVAMILTHKPCDSRSNQITQPISILPNPSRAPATTSNLQIVPQVAVPVTREHNHSPDHSYQQPPSQNMSLRA